MDTSDWESIVQSIINPKEQFQVKQQFPQVTNTHSISFSPSAWRRVSMGHSPSPESRDLSDSFEKNRVRKISMDIVSSPRSSRNYGQGKIPLMANRMVQEQQPFYPLNQVQSDFLLSQDESDDSSDNSETLFGTGIKENKGNDLELVIEGEDVDSTKFKQLCNEIRLLPQFQEDYCFQQETEEYQRLVQYKQLRRLYLDNMKEVEEIDFQFA